ncbi:Ribosome-binding factor A [bioreactor metagenome]|uniref:Ribosome-binding factor A n=1 Tax=bioreactor metagenome TaxID=1076179 RepID=A0A645BAA4_9ZZZZ|nr:30S ribosome-binding factor RbfA [Candidatus Metalachnospira sp.]
MKNNNRMTRINDEIAKEMAQIIRGELKDPRIGVMTSVIRVETTQDLKFCKVFISVLGNDDEKANVMKGLKNAAGYIRHLLAERVNLRVTPELIFKLDDSVEYSIKMSKLIEEISSQPPVGEGEPLE